MTAASTEYNYRKKGNGYNVPLPVKANTTIYAGSMIARDASGWAVPASTASCVGPILGVCAETVVNDSATNGAKQVDCYRGPVRLDNDGVNPVLKTHLGQLAEVNATEDTTVRAPGGSDLKKAGVIIGLDGDYVWVDTSAGAILPDTDPA